MTLTTLGTGDNGVASSVRPRPTSTLEVVDPTKAEAWLARNRKNRNLRMSKVAEYARDMENGNWQETAEAIKFDWNGDIIDGQHRLHAIILAATPIEIFVARGLAPEAQDVIDTGIKRQAADALGMAGASHTHMLASAIRLAVNWESGYLRYATQGTLLRATHSEIKDFLERNPDMAEAAPLAATYSSHILLKPSVILFTAWATRRLNVDQSVSFFNDLAEKRTQGSGDPRSTLLRRLEIVASSRSRFSPVTESYCVFRTWNAVRCGETLLSLNLSSAHGPVDFRGPE